MKRFLKFIVGLPLVVVVVVLSVANRHEVVFSLDPFAQDANAFSVEIPLFVLLFAAAFVGMLVGWAVGWSGQARWRGEARKLRREHAAGSNAAPGPSHVALPRL